MEIEKSKEKQPSDLPIFLLVLAGLFLIGLVLAISALIMIWLGSHSLIVVYFGAGGVICMFLAFFTWGCLTLGSE